MILFKSAAPLFAQLQKLKTQGKKISFVPTMGALHQGHLSLIELSKQTADFTLSSIFVNPTQFNDAKDFEKYPVTTDTDIQLLAKHNTDILFLPPVNVMYPNGTEPTSHYNLGSIETILEGKYRPGHFQGVCQVIHRFLDLIQPHQIILGQKDYQQCMVIKKLIQLLHADTKVVISPTLREANGLAMSSRNMRLSADDKTKAAGIYKALLFIKNNLQKLPVVDLKQHAINQIIDAGFDSVDYVEIADATTLQPITETSNKQKAVALVAAFIGGVRLIDNMVL